MVVHFRLVPFTRISSTVGIHGFMTGHVQPERVKGPGGTQQRKTFSRINDGRRRREGTDRHGCLHDHQDENGTRRRRRVARPELLAAAVWHNQPRDSRDDEAGNCYSLPRV